MTTKDEKREAYRAKCRATEAARREALGLPAWPPVKPARRNRRARHDMGTQDLGPDWETSGDNLGLSPDY